MKRSQPQIVISDIMMPHRNKAFDPMLIDIFKERNEEFLEVWKTKVIR